MTINKSQLRQTIRSQRKLLTIDAQEKAAHIIGHHVITSLIFETSNHVACYQAFAGEVRTQEIISAIWTHQKFCYLPVLHPDKNNTLLFLPYNPGTNLRKNHFGIDEPVFSPTLIFALEKLDLLLIPVVAFDEQGHRLGMGAGFYDRTLALLKNRPQQKRPFLLGLAYEFQRVAEIPPETWDIPLDGIATESRLQLFEKKSPSI